MGLTIPPLKHFWPLLVVWGAAMLMLASSATWAAR